MEQNGSTLPWVSLHLQLDPYLKPQMSTPQSGRPKMVTPQMVHPVLVKMLKPCNFAQALRAIARRWTKAFNV